jgi:DNA-binding XRE family transcriptional regulator
MNQKTATARLTEIAARIKEMREVMGWSKEETAQKTQVSLQEYNAFEGGTADIPFSFMLFNWDCMPFATSAPTSAPILDNLLFIAFIP